MGTALASIRWNQQMGLCYYCHRPVYGKNNPKSKEFPQLLATEDHKRPKSQGGGRGDNMVLACRQCNSDKSNLDETEYMLVLALREAREGEPSPHGDQAWLLNSSS